MLIVGNIFTPGDYVTFGQGRFPELYVAENSVTIKETDATGSNVLIAASCLRFGVLPVKNPLWLWGHLSPDAALEIEIIVLLTDVPEPVTRWVNEYWSSIGRVGFDAGSYDRFPSATILFKPIKPAQLSANIFEFRYIPDAEKVGPVPTRKPFFREWPYTP